MSTGVAMIVAVSDAYAMTLTSRFSTARMTNRLPGPVSGFASPYSRKSATPLIPATCARPTCCRWVIVTVTPASGPQHRGSPGLPPDWGRDRSSRAGMGDDAAPCPSKTAAGVYRVPSVPSMTRSDAPSRRRPRARRARGRPGRAGVSSPSSTAATASGSTLSTESSSVNVRGTPRSAAIGSSARAPTSDRPRSQRARRLARHPTVTGGSRPSPAPGHGASSDRQPGQPADVVAASVRDQCEESDQDVTTEPSGVRSTIFGASAEVGIET